MATDNATRLLLRLVGRDAVEPSQTVDMQPGPQILRDVVNTAPGDARTWAAATMGRAAPPFVILDAMTGGASDWAEAYLNDDQILAKRRAWVDKFRPALELALEEFLASAQWPERERFRRMLTQRGLHETNLDELLREMPRSPWERIPLVPDRVVLSLQVLQELPRANALLDACMALVTRAYESYSSDAEAQPKLRGDDPQLLSAADGDAGLLVRAREILNQHPPSPLGGGGFATDPADWTWLLNDAAVPAFRGVTTVAEYLAAQEKIITADRQIYGRAPALPNLSPFGTNAQALLPARPRVANTPAGLFVIMPFSETWSDGTYAFIRRAVTRIGISAAGIHLYRADEIASPGQISGQIKDAIDSARVVIADITNVNPNVMWELGYADGKGKAIVILNQDPGSSPFDMADRRQVAYHATPTEDDEASLARHLAEAIRIGDAS